MTCKYDAELAEIDLTDQIGQPIMTSDEEEDEADDENPLWVSSMPKTLHVWPSAISGLKTKPEEPTMHLSKYL